MLPTRTAGGGPTRRERRQGREAYAAGGGSSGRVPSVGNHPRLGRMPPTDRIRPGGPPPPAQTWWSAHRHAARRRSSGPISGSLPDESEGRRDRHSGSSCVPIAVACGHSCQRSVVRRPTSRSRVAVASGWMRRSRSRASMMVWGSAAELDEVGRRFDAEPADRSRGAPHSRGPRPRPPTPPCRACLACGPPGSRTSFG